MIVLVINCGSSSIKYKLLDGQDQEVLARGIVARLGEEGSYVEHLARERQFHREMPIPSHREGFDLVLNCLLHPYYGAISDISAVSAVGHRVVHGGDAFTESTLITDDVVAEMERCVPLAPLHNPANVLGVKEARRVLPDVPHVGVFDTAFHQTIPPKAYLYALPREYYEEHRIRRYGFHGTSCRYVSLRAAEILQCPLEELKMVVCHLGNGVTVAAIAGGRSVDTSMGLTPLEGPMMGTRSGDVDAGVVFHLHREVGLSIDGIDELLNRHSGLLGVSGISNDMREVAAAAESGEDCCQLAIDMFAYRVRKYIGAYAAAIGGIDSLVFTAGIGANSHAMRTMICDGLAFLGVELDVEKNEGAIGVERVVSTQDSRVEVLVIPTDEEYMIAMDTLTVIGGLALDEAYGRCSMRPAQERSCRENGY